MDSLLVLLAGPVQHAAPGLLGCRLTGGGVTVRLTEVEAYEGDGVDPASHAYRGRTARNAVMYGPAGFAYVYFTYGMHYCLNVVCGTAGHASAVLLRAGEVVDGVDLAWSRRPAARTARDLARGPARLAQAIGLDRSAYGTCMLDGSGPLLLRPPAVPVDPAVIRRGPRVGVTGGHDTPWRFWLDGDPTVSVYRRHTPRRRAPRPSAS
ncbi:MAG TPA: DNA-3-methyladenine glycosylase [Micromonosporaceae bacterium]